MNDTTVLIAHNTFGTPEDPLYQSRAGVMDQVNAVEQSLVRLGIDYQILPIEDLRHLASLLGSRRERLIFNLAEEFLGTEAACYIPAICKAFGKSCTGNDTPALFLSLNKAFAKAVLRQSGLPCPNGMVFHLGQPVDLSGLTAGRYIMKPACCDASEGITFDSVVDLPADQQKAVKYISDLHVQFNQPVIVEQFIPAHELNVSLVEYNGQIQIMPLAEIDFSALGSNHPRIVDYTSKWDIDSFSYKNIHRKIPANLPQKVAEKVRVLTKAAWQAMSCRDYARVDFRLDEKLNPYILEINPNPDISPDAGFAAAISAGGLTYTQFVGAMIENAEKRMTNNE